MALRAKNDTWAGVGLLFGCILFGMGSLIVAHVSIGSYAMAFWRLLISALIFIGLGLAFGQKFPTQKPAIAFGLLAGVALGLDLALWHESIHAVGPGISTLLNSLQIFFLALIGFVFFKEKQSLLQLVSLVIAVVGVGLIASPEFSHNQGAFWGFVSGMLSGMFLAISMVWVRHTHKIEVVAIFPIMTLVGLGGAMATLPLMVVFDGGAILPKTLSELGWVVAYGAVMQCLAWGLIAYNIPKLSLTVTGLLLLSEPVAALVIDYLWLNKPINGMQWIGASLTMVAIHLGSIGNAKTSH